MVRNVHRWLTLLVLASVGAWADPIEDKLQAILEELEFQTGSQAPDIISELQALHAVLDQSISLVGTDVGEVETAVVEANVKSDNRDAILEEIRDAILALNAGGGATNADIQSAVNSVESAIDNLANGTDLDALKVLSEDQLAELTAILLDLQDFKTANNFDLDALLVEIGSFRVDNSADNLAILLALEDIKLAVFGLESWWSSNYMTQTLDSDDDVPTLIEIRDLLYGGTGSNGAQDVVLGTRNGAGEFEDLRDEIEELDIENSIKAFDNDVSTASSDIESLGTRDLGSFQSEIDNTFASVPVPTFMVHKAVLERHSPIDDYGADIDLLGGMLAFGIPSVTEYGQWLKAVLMLVALWIYYKKFLEMSIYYGEMDMLSVPTQPVTNYGGALGGIVNLPVKLAQLVLMVGALGAIFAIMDNLDQVDGQSIITTIQVLWSTVMGTVIISVGMSNIINVMLGILDAFVPASFMFQLWASYLGTKVGLVFIMWVSTKGQRALS